jgi:hypothetical protein
MSNTQQPAQPLALVRQELPAIEKILALHALPGVDIPTIAAQELMHLEAIAQAKPDILQCTPQSILLAVKSVMQKNLTLDPYAGLVYVKTRSINIGTQDKKEWVKVVEMMPSVNGLISINRQLGRILDYTNPQVIKDGKGKVIGVSMKILKPSFGQPRWELYEYDESDFKRWRTASHRDNGRNKNDANATTLNYANPNYTSHEGGIDPEFARAKCIRHSVKKLGTNPQEQAPRALRPVQQEIIVDPEVDDYAEYTESGDTFTPHVEVNSTTKDTAPDCKIPNSDDL